MGQFDSVIAELTAKRDKIDLVVATLRELDGGGVVEPASEKGPRAVRPKAQVVAKAAPVKRGRPPGNEVTGMRGKVLEILRDGPQASGAIIACLRASNDIGESGQPVYVALNSMKAEGKIVRGKDGVWSLRS